MSEKRSKKETEASFFRAGSGGVGGGGALGLYLKRNAGLGGGARQQPGGRQQREVHGDAFGALGERGVLCVREEAQDIDRVAPRKLPLPGAAAAGRRGEGLGLQSEER